MTNRCFLGALAAILAIACLPFPSVAANVALGDRGELYVAKTGSYGDLFPEDEHGLPADRPVLAVDVLIEGEPSHRLLVPTTGGAERERAPTLGFESASQTLYAIWEAQLEPNVSALYLSGLQTDGWSEPVEISGDMAPLKGAPRVEIVTETYRRPSVDGEGMTERSRTLFHVLWWEESDSREQVYYAAVLLDDGVYPGWNPVIRLNELAGPAADGEREVPVGLLRAPTVRPGRDISSTVIGFADVSARRFVTLDARLLPSELGRIADDLRGEIIEIGHTDNPKQPSKIHDRLRGEIIEIGRELHPGVIDHFARKVVAAYDHLAESEPDLPVEALADDLRGEIIEIGARLFTDARSRPHASVGRVLELEGGGISHLVQLRPVLRTSIPPAGQQNVDVYISEDGRRALVSWIGSKDDQVFYTELVPGKEDEWTPPKKLKFGGGIDRGHIDTVLNQRVSRRP